MTQLYRNKWISSEGDIFKEPEKLSDNFLSWCRKTGHLTNDQWRLAFESLEEKIAAELSAGKDPWPPSYVEFIQLGIKKISPTGMNPEAYKIFESVELIENQTEIDSNKKVAHKILNDLKNLKY